MTTGNSIITEMKEFAEVVNRELANYISSAYPQTETLEKAMKYSLLAGGKRLRPYLVSLFSEVSNGDPKRAIRYGCALEMVHTYSLIHDDLPAMDNDTLRRGKPTCHVVFGEAGAILAGDALLTHAFSVLTDGEDDFEKATRAVSLLSHNAGYAGMAGGQMIDLENEGKVLTESDLELLQNLKTGALIKTACFLGCIAGGIYEGPLWEAAAAYADKIGLCFQVIDDILDGCGDSKLLGKSVGKDLVEEKTTFLSLLGEDKARKYAETLTQEGIEAVSPFDKNGKLASLAKMLLDREY